MPTEPYPDGYQDAEFTVKLEPHLQRGNALQHVGHFFPDDGWGLLGADGWTVDHLSASCSLYFMRFASLGDQVPAGPCSRPTGSDECFEPLFRAMCGIETTIAPPGHLAC